MNKLVPGTFFLDKFLSNRKLVPGIALSSVARSEKGAWHHFSG
jgi:hypothetical protein